jgi:hypothetical protein
VNVFAGTSNQAGMDQLPRSLSGCVLVELPSVPVEGREGECQQWHESKARQKQQTVSDNVLPEAITGLGSKVCTMIGMQPCACSSQRLTQADNVGKECSSRCSTC